MADDRLIIENAAVYTRDDIKASLKDMGYRNQGNGLFVADQAPPAEVTAAAGRLIAEATAQEQRAMAELVPEGEHGAMTVRISRTGRWQVNTPYDKARNGRLQRAGGTWDPIARYWVFDRKAGEALRKAIDLDQRAAAKAVGAAASRQSAADADRERRREALRAVRQPFHAAVVTGAGRLAAARKRNEGRPGTAHPHRRLSPRVDPARKADAAQSVGTLAPQDLQAMRTATAARLETAATPAEKLELKTGLGVIDGALRARGVEPTSPAAERHGGAPARGPRSGPSLE